LELGDRPEHALEAQNNTVLEVAGGSHEMVAMPFVVFDLQHEKVAGGQGERLVTGADVSWF